MITIQSKVVQKLRGLGFNQSHKHDGSTVYMSKYVRPWKQALAAVGADGKVNGESLSEFLSEIKI
jgi:hypothetical protein